VQGAGPTTAVIDSALRVWFALTALSAAYVAWDAWRRTPEMSVMKWGWVLVTLYTGPVGGALYVLSCQEPRPDTHEDFVRPLWKQALGSSIHCMAGDATGVILAAAVTAALGLTMGKDIIVEYAFGFAFGLFVFQALFMRDMLGGSYTLALRRSFLPEWLSMNAVMAGMIPVMVVLMTRDMRAMDPAGLRFWGVMSLASLVAMILASPVNAWLVAAGLKHGMGTVRALGRGGHSMAAEHGGANPAPAAAQSHNATGSAHVVGSAGVVRPRATPAQIVAVTLLTLVLLGAGTLIAALGGQLGMAHEMTSRTTQPTTGGPVPPRPPPHRVP
jgi:hypothetical protein